MFDLRKLKLEEMSGEKAKVRWIRHDDPEEMKRLVSIDMDENVRRYVLNATGDEEDLSEFAKGTRKSIGIAIAGKTEHVGDSETDKLQGWIAVYLDHPRRLARAAQNGLLVFDQNKTYLEVGFARYPLAKQGQMSSALRVVINSLQTFLSEEKINWCLTGYTHPNNEGSKRVLLAAGFVKVGELSYTLKDKHRDDVYLYKPG